MYIRVKYHDGMDEYPLKVSVGNAGIDLYAARDYELKKGDFALIDLGVSIMLPPACWAMLLPRSSTYKKWGIIQTNSVGIIDETYQGDNDIWMMPVLAMRDTVIKRGDRVAQMIVRHDLTRDCVIVQTDHLRDTDRGGFGSTGSNYSDNVIVACPKFPGSLRERSTMSNK